MKPKLFVVLSILLIAAFGLGACEYPAGSAEEQPAQAEALQPAAPATEAAAPSPTPEPPTPTPSPTPQPHAAPASYGPELETFPAGYSPLSGQPVCDPSALELPAVLVSVSHFPAAIRPESGLSFAPWTFELYISEGMTRFLTVFYGEYPYAEAPVTGGCAVRAEPFQAEAGLAMLGSRVWLDRNQNGIQDGCEPGIGGACVNLYDAASGELLQSTTTDSNGYYGFNLRPDGLYTLEVQPVEGLSFTLPNLGDEDHDSDVEPATGRTAAISLSAPDLTWDAGLLQPSGAAGNPAAGGHYFHVGCAAKRSSSAPASSGPPPAARRVSSWLEAAASTADSPTAPSVRSAPAACPMSTSATSSRTPAWSSPAPRANCAPSCAAVPTSSARMRAVAP